DLHALDRPSGVMRWAFHLPAGLSTTPVVDEERIYLPTATSRLYALRLPDVIGQEVDSISEGLGRAALYGGRDEGRGEIPRLIWSDVTNIQLSFAPVQSGRELFVYGPTGRGIGFDKEPREGARNTELYRLSTEGRISVPGTALGNTAYIGSDD